MTQAEEDGSATTDAAAAAATSPSTTTDSTPSTTDPVPQVKKQRVVVVNPCPASVATAYMILRGTVAGLLGLDLTNTSVEVSILQPTYIKEGVPSAKFSITCGKKLGTGGLVQLSEDPSQQLEFLTLVEQTANRIISEHHIISVVQMGSADEAQEYYGSQIFHQGNRPKPTKATTGSTTGSTGGSSISTSTATTGSTTASVLVAQIPNLITCIPPALPYATTNIGLTSIVLDHKQSYISCGKKAKKAEVVFKFLAMENTNMQTKSTSHGEDQNEDNTNTCTTEATAIIQTEPFPNDSMPFFLLPEGQILYEQQQAKTTDVDVNIVATTTTTINDDDVTKSNTANDDNINNNDNSCDNTNDTMIVNAFEVSGKIDYNKLVDKFGSKIIDTDLMGRLAALTVGKGRVPILHRFLRRNIFFSHRDLHSLLDCVERNRPIYLYTGRGPSSAAMHLGHLVPFLFTQWLQQALDCPLVIQMTDDEKFLFKGQYDEEDGDNLQHFADLTIENARDIIACGFNPEKTFIFSDLDYVGVMYPNIVRIWKAVTTNTVNGIFGFDGTSNIGKIAFPAIQAAPAFSSSFPVVLRDAPPDTACLIPCAIDQDPYFRMTRDVAHKLVPKACRPHKSADSSTATTTAGSEKEESSNQQHHYHALGGKPALIHSKFFPPLQGSEGKMSSSDTNSAIFLTDTSEEIELKIKQHAFSGGQESKQLQQELGADLDLDVSYQWLRFFLEDDEELESIGQSYASGKGEYWSTGAVKKRLVQVLQELVAEHQERRSKISDEEVRKWMAQRNIMGQEKKSTVCG